MRITTCLGLLAIAFLPCTTNTLADEVRASSSVGILVTTGQEQDAIDYYVRIAPKLGVKNTEADLPDLSALLRHFGLSLTGEQLEAITPSDLMQQFPSQALAARFFAPKIVDFNFPSNNPAYPFKAGWRKIVRLTARTGSKADAAGLAAAYILFNYVQADPKANPFPDAKFTVESFNTQAILVPKTFKEGAEDSALFLDFDTKTKKYAIHRFLDAAFDTARDPNQTKKSYYVPVACAQCHGHDQEGGSPANNAPVKTGTFPFVKVNYLDTDHWYDMVSLGDFPSTQKGTFDVLFDGGTDHASAQHKAAMTTLRTLNAAIRQQNVDSARADGSDAFKVKAVEKWLIVHKAKDGPVSPIDRSLDLGNGSAVWQSNAADQHLLTTLDHYCFRCHSSILYDVFDKQGVIEEKAAILRRIQLPKESVLHMPQGRVLDAPTIADLVNSIKAMK